MRYIITFCCKTLLVLLVSSQLAKGKVMLGATFAELKKDYNDNPTYNGWKEQLTNDGLPLVTYSDSEQPRILICSYFQDGVVKNYALVAMFNEYWTQMLDYCQAHYKQIRAHGRESDFLDEKLHIIWNLKNDQHGDVNNREIWTVTLTAVRAPSSLTKQPQRRPAPAQARRQEPPPRPQQLTKSPRILNETAEERRQGPLPRPQQTLPRQAYSMGPYIGMTMDELFALYQKTVNALEWSDDYQQVRWNFSDDKRAAVDATVLKGQVVSFSLTEIDPDGSLYRRARAMLNQNFTTYQEHWIDQARQIKLILVASDDQSFQLRAWKIRAF